MRRTVSLGGFFGAGISFRMSLSFFSEITTVSFYGIPAVRVDVSGITGAAQTTSYSFSVSVTPMILPIQLLIRVLQKMGRNSRRTGPQHLALGESGESEAYFFLKRQGYRMVASNFRVVHARGEIDFIGWDGDVLCFVEVKTRSDDSFAPPSTAVTDSKQRHILSVAKRYLRRVPGRPPCRFDILSIVPGELLFTLHKGAFTWDSTSSRRERSSGDRGRISRRPR